MLYLFNAIYRYNKVPTAETEKAQNISIALHFIQDAEHIPLANIGK